MSIQPSATVALCMNISRIANVVKEMAHSNNTLLYAKERFYLALSLSSTSLLAPARPVEMKVSKTILIIITTAHIFLYYANTKSVKQNLKVCNSILLMLSHKIANC